MSYKIIFTDLDDTLLNSEKKISSVDKEAIMRAQEAGVKFVLASGRPTFAMYDLAKELELDKYGSFILSFNGSIITDCRSGENIFEASLTKEDLHLMYDFAKENKTHILTYIDDEVVSETESEYIDVEVQASAADKAALDKEMQEAYNKLTQGGDFAKIVRESGSLG